MANNKQNIIDKWLKDNMERVFADCLAGWKETGKDADEYAACAYGDFELATWETSILATDADNLERELQLVNHTIDPDCGSPYGRYGELVDALSNVQEELEDWYDMFMESYVGLIESFDDTIQNIMVAE